MIGKYITTVLVAMIVLAFCCTNARAALGYSDLLAWWQGEGNVNDSKNGFHATSINELATLITNVVGEKTEVLHSPAESGGVSRLCADLTTARKLLNYEPRVDLAQGLRLTLKHDSRFQR